MQNGLFHITSYCSSTFTTIITRLCRNSVRIILFMKRHMMKGIFRTKRGCMKCRYTPAHVTTYSRCYNL